MEKVAGYSLSPAADADEEKKYLGQMLTIRASGAALLENHGSLGAPKQWDTRSHAWLEEFRTNPKDLDLPRFVRTHDLGFATVIMRTPTRLLLNLGGTWYSARRIPFQ